MSSYSALETVEPLPTKIDSNLLPWYFLFKDYPEIVSPSDISQNLDLTAWKPWIVELMEAIDRVEVKRNERDYTPVSSSMLDVLEAIKKTTGEGITSDRELMRFIYWSKEKNPNGSVEATPIIYGEHDVVYYNYYQFYANGQEPLLQIHNHPGGGFLSLEDLELLVTGIEVNGKLFRHINGIMVVARSIQILALATKDTPVFSDKTWKELVKHGWEALKSSQLVERLKRAFGSEEGAQAAIRMYYIDLLAQQMPDYTQLPRDQRIILNYIQEQIIEGGKQHARDMIVVCRDLLGLKLYSSSDMGNFVEFTA